MSTALSRCLCLVLIVGWMDVGDIATDAAEPRSESDALIGYTELRTNLPGRFANNITMRSFVCRADGAVRRAIGEDLANEPHSWTQFAGWSPDGKTAVIGRGWESPENGQWEEEHQTFRFTDDGWLYDVFFHDLASGRSTNVTAVDRVSKYNSGVFYWPKEPSKLGFTALINGISHPFQMDLDGRNKKDLSGGAEGFTYGFNTSPDGSRIAYHRDYQIYVARADGSKATRVDTGNPFNFAPQWSPDGNWLVFVSGEHYDCHPYVVKADGTGLRKLADRGGYRGVIEFLDVFDFHGGSSDVPGWSSDGWLYFTAMFGDRVELMRVRPEEGAAPAERLTQSEAGVLHYHPRPSPSGGLLLFGSKRQGVRELYVMDLSDRSERKITPLKPGHAAMWGHWQPSP